MSKLNDKQLEAFRFGLDYLSIDAMKELLFEIVSCEIREIEDCINFTYHTRVKVGYKILEALRKNNER